MALIGEKPKRRVVVTGTSSGIGRQTALAFARRGWEVTGTVRTEHDAADLAADAGRHDLDLCPVLCDITDDDAVATLADRFSETGLDVLVNNAGVVTPGPIELVGADELRDLLEVNVVGQVRVTNSCLAALRRCGGRLIFVSSASGSLPFPYLGAYAASKAALEAIAEVLRVEVAPFGVHVVLISPGNAESTIWEKAGGFLDGLDDPEGLYGEAVEHLREFTSDPRRPMSTEAVAETIVAAATTAKPRSRYDIGLDARAAHLARHLPEGLRNLIWKRRYSGIHRR